MPHFEWLGLATSGPQATAAWTRVLIFVVAGWIVGMAVLAAVLLLR